jgi:hypothetical protein
MAEVVLVIWGEREAEYLCNQDWTGQISLIWKEKLVFRRMRFSRHCERKRSNPPSEEPSLG